jgi:hypothetical protein
MKLTCFLIPAAFLLAAGCASTNSGDVRIPGGYLRRMLSDREVKPVSEIKVVWKNFPYKNATDTIGEGSLNPVKPQPLPAPINDMVWLKERAMDIFSDAGLYDAQKGSGTITITLTSYGRWTYGEIFRSFLVDTGYILLIPASLLVNHQLVVEYDGASGHGKVEELGRNKTTFHAILFPLYPFFRPGAKEHSLLKKMLRRSSADLYAKTKPANAPAAPSVTPEAAPKPAPQPAQIQPAETTTAPPAEAPKAQPAPKEMSDD